MEALLLAAGHGTRLLPVTRTYPKPLFPVLNMPSLVYVMRYLKSHGIEDFFVNTFHLAKALEKEVLWSSPGQVSFSREEKLLGTGGGIKRMLAMTKGDTVLISNTDAIYNFDMDDLLNSHKESGCPITLGLVPHSDPGYAKVGIGKNGLVRSFREEESHEGGLFTGIHVVTKSMLPRFPEKEVFCIIEDYYAPFVKKDGRIGSKFLAGDFLDIGDLKKYLQTNLRLLKDLSGFKVISDHLDRYYLKAQKGVFIHREAKLPKLTKIVPPAVVGNCSIGNGCSIDGAIIGDGSKIGDNASVKDSITLCASNIPEHTVIERSIIFGSESIKVG